MTAVPARADERCEIVGFSPHAVTVGLSPKVVTFDEPEVDGCDSVELWSLDGDSFYVYTDAPQEVFDPYDNSQAKPQDVVVTVYNGDYAESNRVFRKSFTVKRKSVLDRVNATPEPVKKGRKIAVRGRLRTADWGKDAYVGGKGHHVQVQFRTKGGDYKTLKTVQTRSKGALRTTLTAKADGYWRLRYPGNSVAGSAVSAGDFVDVQ